MPPTPLLANFWTDWTAPWRLAPWNDWIGFWQTWVLDDRLLITYAVALLPFLLLTPPRYLRPMIIATAAVFLTWLWGAFYAALWFAMCTAFFYLGERYDRECRRTDVWKYGPPVAATLLISGWYIAMLSLGKAIQLPPDVEAWLHESAPWLYAFGGRFLTWEPSAMPRPSSVRLFDLFDPYFAHLCGTAYLAVRLTHYFAEIRRGGIPRESRSLLNFLAWVCYIPNQMQGPIERYGPFHTQLELWHAQRCLSWALLGLVRIAYGIGKSVVAHLYFTPFILTYLAPPPGASASPYYDHPETIANFAVLYFGVAVHIVWLYIEFSGYCDISAGIAWILGYRQIENFDWPWISRSLREFWRRWHISLSLILRDYIYIPLGGSRVGHPLRNLALTFIICGLWHVLWVRMFWWGLAMGVMLWINQLWVQWMDQLDAAERGLFPALRRGWLRLKPLPQICAWLVTMHAFVFSLLIFFGGLGALRVLVEIARRVTAGLFG